MWNKATSGEKCEQWRRHLEHAGTLAINELRHCIWSFIGRMQGGGKTCTAQLPILNWAVSAVKTKQTRWYNGIKGGEGNFEEVEDA